MGLLVLGSGAPVVRWEVVSISGAEGLLLALVPLSMIWGGAAAAMVLCVGWGGLWKGWSSSVEIC